MMGDVTADDLEMRERMALLDNLASTQERCTELLEHSRDLRELVRVLFGLVGDEGAALVVPEHLCQAALRAQAIVRGGTVGRCGQCGRFWDDLAALSTRCNNFRMHVDAICRRSSPVSTQQQNCLCKVEGGERFAHPACLSLHELSAVGIVLPNGSTRRGGWAPTIEDHSERAT